MENRIHGVLSLGWIFLAILIALVTIWAASWALGLMYALVVTLGALVIIYAYCAKCDLRHGGCRHLFPGPIARQLPLRKPGPYTARDYFGVVLPLVPVVIIPQYWLKAAPFFLVLFWGLLAVAVVEILVFVCRGCANTRCPMCALRNP